MWFVTMFRLMWDVWTSAPRCEQSCGQGREPCKCKGAKHG
jgi:hypothetical protein